MKNNQKMLIEKKQKDKNRYALNWSFFDSARDGFRYILQSEIGSARKILLPAYLGFSKREGSGVFDPIRETKTEYVFYKIDKNLHINLDDLKEKIRLSPDNILFIIHYFGFKDRNLNRIKEYARRHKMQIIEDYAHAFFTFYLNSIIDFDYAIFSIHKLFPTSSGGMVLGGKKLKDDTKKKYDLFKYDLNSIIRKRLDNYKYCLEKLNKLRDSNSFRILRRQLGDSVPQTLPILLKNEAVRDYLYYELNKRGYGVVSLYHELIAEVPQSFTEEYYLSKRILNLPIHQDVEQKDLSEMINLMDKLTKEFHRSCIHG